MYITYLISIYLNLPQCFTQFQGMMFPPSLYEYVVNEQKKNMILVLNKIDLVPASLVAAWKEYLVTKCPGLRVVYFTSCPGYNLAGGSSDKAGEYFLFLF